MKTATILWLLPTVWYLRYGYRTVGTVPTVLLTHFDLLYFWKIQIHSQLRNSRQKFLKQLVLRARSEEPPVRADHSAAGERRRQRFKSDSVVVSDDTQSTTTQGPSSSPASNVSSTETDKAAKGLSPSGKTSGGNIPPPKAFRDAGLNSYQLTAFGRPPSAAAALDHLRQTDWLS